MTYACFEANDIPWLNFMGMACGHGEWTLCETASWLFYGVLLGTMHALRAVDENTEIPGATIDRLLYSVLYFDRALNTWNREIIKTYVTLMQFGSLFPERLVYY